MVAINEIAQSQDEVMAFVMGTNSTERRVRVVEEPPQMNVEPRALSTSEV